jgi:hypothetical protein
MAGEPRSAGGCVSGAPVDLSALEPGTYLIALYQGDAELARVAARSPPAAHRIADLMGREHPATDRGVV